MAGALFAEEQWLDKVPPMQAVYEDAGAPVLLDGTCLCVGRCCCPPHFGLIPDHDQIAKSYSKTLTEPASGLQDKKCLKTSFLSKDPCTAMHEDAGRFQDKLNTMDTSTALDEEPVLTEPILLEDKQLFLQMQTVDFSTVKVRGGRKSRSSKKFMMPKDRMTERMPPIRE